MNEELLQICKKAKAAKPILQRLGTNEKNSAILAVADGLIANTDAIIAANKIDMTNGEIKGLSQGLLDRLLLTPERIVQMAEGLRQVVALEDPIGEVISMKRRPNGLNIGQRRVPLGVVGIIYEARPNVTADAFGLCFKTSNVVILKGGSDAINSNLAITNSIRSSLEQLGITPDAINLITATDREATTEFMRMNGYIDVLIPRGGAGLIQSVVANATVPVIETGTGNCHIYVDISAEFDMALNIIENAKTQRIGVCNACESLVINRALAEGFLPRLNKVLSKHNVEIRGDEAACAICPSFTRATEEDWGAEYLDYIISVKIVDSIEEAIEHINKYNTGHSEAIISKNYTNIDKFMNEIDAACVYVNASTRFTDGYEFGFGAEIGISTQKLHARGPMGLQALTSTKYIIYGDGQIR